jgi:hypothetical protein
MTTLYEQLKHAYNDNIREQNLKEQDKETRYGIMIKNKLEHAVNNITVDDAKYGEYTLISIKHNDYFHLVNLNSRCRILNSVVSRNDFHLPVRFGFLHGNYDSIIGCRAYVKWND